MGRWADRYINCYGNKDSKYWRKIKNQMGVLEDRLLDKLECPDSSSNLKNNFK